MTATPQASPNINKIRITQFSIAPEQQSEDNFAAQTQQQSESQIQQDENIKRIRKDSLVLVLIFVIIYSLSDLIMPLYNKLLFKGLGSSEGFHYPITAAMVQTGAVTLLLGGYCVVKHQLKTQVWNQKVDHWLLTNFWRKNWELFFVSLFFAGVMILSNIGLDNVSLNIHVLLRTTTIVWVVIFSTFYKEIPSLLTVLAALLILVGAVLLSLDVSLGWSFEKGNFLGVAINLASSFCSGFMAVLLRKVCLRSAIEGSPIQMTIIEITVYKMFQSTIFILIPAVIVDSILAKPSIWVSLFNQFEVIAPMLLGGVFVTLLYQTMVVALTAYVQAISVGILHQFLVFPQLILYTVLINTKIIPERWKLSGLHLNSPYHVAGSILILGGAISYAIVQLVRRNLWKKPTPAEAASINNETESLLRKPEEQAAPVEQPNNKQLPAWLKYIL